MIKMPVVSEKFVKIARTCILYLSYFSLGMCVAVPGPTLIDLQRAVNTDTKHIALIYSSRSVGYLFGSLFGGIMFDCIKRKQIPLILCNFVMSLSAVATPWCLNLGTLVSAMAIGGLAMGALDTGSNVWCLNIWKKGSAPFLQALHFAFGCGGFFGPLIAAPFLSEEPLDLNDNSSESHFKTIMSLTYNHTTSFPTTIVKDSFTKDLADYDTQYLNETDITGLDSSSNIKYIYSIIGGFSFLVTFLFVLLYFLTTKEEDNSEEKKEDTVKGPGALFTCVVGFLISFLLFIYAGIEIGYAQMLVTYAVKGELKLSKTTGSYMTSAFWGTFTFSRGIGIFLSLKFSCLTLMIVDLVLTLISGVILLTLGASSEMYLWIGTALLGVSLASFFPSAISWIELYIIVNNRVASGFSIGAAIGEMVIPLLISQFIESFPQVLFYAVVCSGVLCSIMLLVLWFIVKRKGKKAVNEIKNSKSNDAYEEDKF